MTNPRPMKRAPAALALAVALLLSACGAGSHPAAAAPCDQACQDGVALRGLRTLIKLAYNLTVQGQPVGAQNKTEDCLPSNGSTGKAHVFGDATSNAAQGSSFVDLSFDFRGCAYPAAPDPSAEQNFDLTVDGLITEHGTLAVQPSSTSALLFHSDAVSISGTVYDPPIDYAASECVLDLNQDGNRLAGTLCGRSAGFSF